METLINRGYKFKIVPSKEQKEFFLQSFGCARKIYNISLIKHNINKNISLLI